MHSVKIDLEWAKNLELKGIEHRVDQNTALMGSPPTRFHRPLLGGWAWSHACRFTWLSAREIQNLCCCGVPLLKTITKILAQKIEPNLHFNLLRSIFLLLSLNISSWLLLVHYDGLFKSLATNSLRDRIMYREKTLFLIFGPDLIKVSRSKILPPCS